jgi:hypothetical protein
MYIITVSGLVVILIYHTIQHVSFIISNQPEVDTPHNDGHPKWLAKGVVVSNRTLLVYTKV